MSYSSDGFDEGGSHEPGASAEQPGQTVEALLLESLCYVLIEKGLLTKNDVLSVVETVAMVKQASVAGAGGGFQDADDLRLLRRLFGSFEALDGRPGDGDFAQDNVIRLRPPLHQDRPEFPAED